MKDRNECEFSLGAVLTFITGKVLCDLDDGDDGVIVVGVGDART